MGPAARLREWSENRADLGDGVGWTGETTLARIMETGGNGGGGGIAGNGPVPQLASRNRKHISKMQRVEEVETRIPTAPIDYLIVVRLEFLEGLSRAKACEVAKWPEARWRSTRQELMGWMRGALNI